MSQLRKIVEGYQRNGLLVRSVRTINRLSLRDLSNKTGVDHTTIHRFEKGHNVSAIAYLALVNWAVMNNPNIH